MQFELTKEFISEISNAINKGDSHFIVSHVNELHPADIAEIMDYVNLQEAQYIYELLDEEQAADVLVEIDEDVRDKFLASLSAKEIAESIENMDSDDATDLIQDLPEKKQEEVLSEIKDESQSSDISDLLAYEEDSAGGIMAKEFVAANSDWTVKEALTMLRKQVEDVDNVYTIYVTNVQSKLLGTLSLKKFLYASDQTLIKDLYRPDPIVVNAMVPAEEVASIMEKYELVVIPVVNDLGVLIGRITIDDALEVIKEEAEKDYQMASGISEKVESSDNILTLSRARLPWLLIGLTGGILGAYVIGGFEDKISEFPVMASFIPLILAMGGNVGVQSSAIIVQSLANNSLEIETIAKKLIKELLVALVNGVICSLIALVFCLFTENDPLLSLTIGVALISVFLYAGLFGTFIPLILNRYKIDPALATGPFITTTNDVIGLLLYFLIGWALYFPK
ncbi:MAG: magnesium transporter [Bacteroidota bacterium]|nr:magnesium transporter [Bacteroidota bacterium]MEC8968827.1 magnesium transporter [Bacteroidota bacterium]